MTFMCHVEQSSGQFCKKGGKSGAVIEANPEREVVNTGLFSVLADDVF